MAPCKHFLFFFSSFLLPSAPRAAPAAQQEPFQAQKIIIIIKKKQSVCAELWVGAVPVGEEFRLHHSHQKPLLGHKGTRAGRFLLNPSLVELQTRRGKEILTCQSAYFLSRAEEPASTSRLHAGAARRWKIVAALGHLRATGGLLEISLSSHPFCLVCF